MGKHLNKVPKLEDFKTPWEEKGEEIDPAKAKSFIHYLTRTKAEADDKVEEVTKAKETEIAALQAKIDDKARENETDAEKAARESAAAIQKAKDDAKAEAGVETLKLRVALRKGLTEVQAKRLVGTTEDEIEKDADDLLESFGGKGEAEEGGEGEPRTRPTRPLKNGGDPKDGEPTFDPEKAADAYVGSGISI